MSEGPEALRCLITALLASWQRRRFNGNCRFRSANGALPPELKGIRLFAPPGQRISNAMVMPMPSPGGGSHAPNLRRVRRLSGMLTAFWLV